MQKREMHRFGHDCYCTSKTHSHFIGIFLTYEHRRKSIFSSKKGNEIQVSLNSLLKLPTLAISKRKLAHSLLLLANNI